MWRLIVTVLTSVTAAVAGLLVVRHLVPFSVLHDNNEVAGNYLQTVGTIYAVLLAFVVFVVWSQFNEARSHVERETNELSDLFRIARCLHMPALIERARAYARAVIDEEWQAMAGKQHSERARCLLEEMWLALEQMPDGPEGINRQNTLYAEALARFNGLNDARTDRLWSSRTKLPLILWILLVSGGLITVGSMYLFGLRSQLFHALMTGAMAGAVSHVLYLIWDFDNCFSGDWQVEKRPFELVLEQMDGCFRPGP